MTAGRAAGHFAKLAQSLAAAESMQEMSEMAAGPPEDILPYAEQCRFTRISERSMSAAEKLVCFALPFTRRDAEEIFPTDTVGSAIHELLMLGLLRPHDENSFEMHETVRAGLEGTIALNVRHSAHEALAEWYGRQGLMSAEILHLDMAGKHDEARKRARDTFLEGKQWGALAAYVTRNKLVSSAEVISVVTGPGPVGDKYLLSGILRDLAEPVAVDELLRALREQPERSSSDYQWGLAVSETILQFEPSRLCDLIQLCVEMPGDRMRKESALGWLRIASSRKNGAIEPRTLDYFRSQPTEIKRLLVPLMLIDCRRDVLQLIFQFMASDPEKDGERRRPAAFGFPLRIGDRNDAVEFLAAVPPVDTAAMLMAKSPLLGRLEDFAWVQRKALSAYCVEILQDAAMEDAVLESAIRVLVFLGEPNICALCDPLVTRKGRVGGLAKLVPALVPILCDRELYEQKFLNRDLKVEDRCSALSVLALVGADLGPIYQRLKATESDPANVERWNPWFVALCAQTPFPDAIPLLEAQMKTADEPSMPVIVSALTRLGGLPVPAATAMLARALSHADSRFRTCAAIGVANRRSRAALPSLINHFKKENDANLAVTMATAIMASGARSIENLRHDRYDTPALRLWICVLAARLRDVTAGDLLVTIACDSSQNWRLRRAAIFAAGRLPYQIALEKIVPQVMAERSPFEIDKTQNLLCHSTLASLLLTEAQGMLQIFVKGEAYFIEFFGEIFEECWQGSMLPQGRPTGVQAAGWLFERLNRHGWPTRVDAPDLVISELHIPILQSAILRALRLNGQPDIIEDQLSRARDLWIAVKCVLERSRAGNRDAELASRLRSPLETSSCKGEPLLERIIAERFDNNAVQARAPVAATHEEPPAPLVSHVSYADVVRALSGEKADFNVKPALILEPVEAEKFEHLVRLADPANDRHQSSENRSSTTIPGFRWPRS